MRRIKGLFLDLDGTLADSMPMLKKVFRTFLETHGIKPQPAEFRDMSGFRLFDIMVYLKERHALPLDPANLVDDYLALVGDRYQDEAAPTPGARRLLETARERGLYVAVVTSSPGQSARDFLEAHGLAGFVSGLVSADNVIQGKPHPEPFLKALGLAGLEPALGLAVEDSTAGAQSALSAGLRTYLIGVHEPPPQVPGAAGRISRLDELVRHL